MCQIRANLRRWACLLAALACLLALLPLHSPGNEPLNEQGKSAHAARRFPSENTSGY